MADEYNVYNELEAQRNLDSQLEEQLATTEASGPEPWKMGAGSYVLILFALFADIIEFITTYITMGAGVIISVPLGFAVDAAIFIGVGMSKKARKQWKRFAVGFIAENFPILASVLEFIPFRTLALIWMYRGMSMQAKEQSEEEKEETNNE